MLFSKRHTTWYLKSVEGITVLCHFHKNYLMSVIRCLTSLQFWSLFHLKSIPFCPKTHLSPNSFCISLIRQIGFPIHFIWVTHCCPLVLIKDIAQMWQNGCHIWNYYIIMCYKMLAIFTYNDKHQVIFTKMTQYCYSLDWKWCGFRPGNNEMWNQT